MTQDTESRGISKLAMLGLIVAISAGVYYGPRIIEKIKNLQGNERISIENSISYDNQLERSLYTERDE